MTSYVEQYFFYGDIDTEEPLPGPLKTLLAYADLTIGAAIIFAAVVLLSLAKENWGILSSFVSAGAKKFVLSPIQAIRPFLNCHMLELIRFPWLDGVYSAARYVSGLVDGWNAQTQSPDCPGAISRYHLNDWLSQDRLSETYYCLGEKSGLRLHALVMNDWLSPSRFVGNDGKGEISHFYALALVSCVISFAIMAMASYILLPRAAVFQHVKSSLFQLESQYPLGTPITQKESDLWNMISQYEVDIDRKKAQLASKSTLLDAAVSELHASKARQEEGWVQLGILADRRNRALEAQYHEQSLSRKLRQQLVETGGKLKVAEGRIRDEREELANAHRQVADQRKQIFEEQKELDHTRQQLLDNQQLANHHQKLAEERERLDGVRDQLAAQCQQFAEEHQRLVAENQQYAEREQGLAQEFERLVAENQQQAEKQKGLVQYQEPLTHEHQELINQGSQLNASLKAAQRERDEALTQAMSLQLDLDSTTMTASITYAHSQESLSRAQQAESTLQQAMADLKSACNQTLAQERAASQEARSQASGLSAEVNDLETKIGMAMRDAQRSHEQATNAQGTIDMLEHRLARHQAVQSGSTQEIPKRQTGNTGSMATALADKEVAVAAQTAEIANIKRQLEQVKKEAPAAAPQQPADPAIKEGFQKLRAVLEKERRARTEDNVRWGSKTRDLEADNQKLRVSLSNAEAQGGSLRPGTPRRSPARP